MRSALALSANLLAAVLAVGCFEGKARLTFNPDGSVKIAGEVTLPVAPPWVPARKAPGDELKNRALLLGVQVILSFLGHKTFSFKRTDAPTSKG